MSDKERAAQNVTLMGGFVNLLLTGLKGFIGVITNSAGLIADAIHSLTDLATDLFVWLAISFGKKEADENHPHGHKRFETIATLVVGILVFVTGMGIIIEMASQIQTTEWTNPNELAFSIIIVSIFAKEILFRWTRRIARKYNNALLEANAVHHRTDALSSIVVLAGLIATYSGFELGDLLAAVLVGAMLVRTGIKISKGALLEMSEAGVDKETLEKIVKTIETTGGVVSAHFVKTRLHAGEILGEAHVEVDPRLTVTEGHEISERVFKRVKSVVPNIRELIIHIDPEDDEIQLPEYPSGHSLRSFLNEKWSEFNPDNQLQSIIIHLLHTGVEVSITVGDDVKDEQMMEFKNSILKDSRIDIITFNRQVNI